MSEQPVTSDVPTREGWWIGRLPGDAAHIPQHVVMVGHELLVRDGDCHRDLDEYEWALGCVPAYTAYIPDRWQATVIDMIEELHACDPGSDAVVTLRVRPDGGLLGRIETKQDHARWHKARSS